MTLLQYLKYITKCIVSNYKQLTITKIMLIITELVIYHNYGDCSVPDRCRSVTFYLAKVTNSSFRYWYKAFSC